jgi:hypothetical protein
LIKTFWGWSDQQLSAATVIWTSPSGHTYITTPGSALLFPNLCAPTGTLAPPDPDATRLRCVDRAAMMPKRRHTRTHNRARYIADQRRDNRKARQAASCGPAPPDTNDDDPPPF